MLVPHARKREKVATPSLYTHPEREIWGREGGGSFPKSGGGRQIIAAFYFAPISILARESGFYIRSLDGVREIKIYVRLKVHLENKSYNIIDQSTLF
jgi:hypothetical protein